MLFCWLFFVCLWILIPGFNQPNKIPGPKSTIFGKHILRAHRLWNRATCSRTGLGFGAKWSNKKALPRKWIFHFPRGLPLYFLAENRDLSYEKPKLASTQSLSSSALMLIKSHVFLMPRTRVFIRRMKPGPCEL